MAQPAAVTLDDKYLLEEGTIFLSGVQALVRVALDAHRADARAGRRTATFVSGYQGSPLGGLDKELLRIRPLWAEHDLHVRPALNEELGATSVWGSQLAPSLPGATRDGVVGLWYGKNPGLDRAADAIRHANLCGTPRTGGAVAIVGDDPASKSSTMPSAAEEMLRSLGLPVLFPGSVQDVLDLGLHAVALSRASGLWAGLKIVTAVADAAATARVAPGRVAPVLPEVLRGGRGYVHVPNPTMLAPDSLISERTMDVRLEIARRYAVENGLNRVTFDAADAWLGIVAGGKAYADLLQALRDLGLHEGALRRAGVRVLRLGMTWPLDRDQLRAFAAGLREILVVEEKRPFVEAQLKELLYGTADAPRIVGKSDERDRLLLPAEGELDADLVARAVAARLRAGGVEVESVDARMRELEEAGRAKLVPLPVVRTPFFCSGCPHNSSTVADDDALVGAGIGCHTMILLNREGRGRISGITQMGGEGAQWIGIAPFVEDEHFVQNLGDGTFHHSGSLAVRAAVAAGVNVTYKLLYNSAVAMTGGQAVEGAMGVPALTRWFAVEGVRRVVVTTEDPSRYAGVALDPIASVRHRDAMLDVQRELAAVEGVTVLIHDGQCAAERRRLRKRGVVPESPVRVHINERVCEGCGDCGQKSGCLSVVPVATEFGRKTAIHQASCNTDLSCLKGDCPSFLEIVPAAGAGAKAAVPAPPAVPDAPARAGDADVTIRMVGIGGTGVVTVSQVLGMAAHLEGRHVTGLDQTGLSQKGGPVVSDLRIAASAGGTGRASAARVDVYLGFDLLGAANPKNLQAASPGRTVAVLSTALVPTGRMVVDPTVASPDAAAAVAAVGAQTRAAENVVLDAQQLSERLFADHMPANVIALGAASQAGLLPVSAASIEAAIRLNGAAVARNLAAFGWGRACVAAPDAVAALLGAGAAAPDAPLDAESARIVASVGAPGGSELERLLRLRVPDLIAYQDVRYAARYAAHVADAVRAETALGTGSLAVSEAVARGLHKLMAYKDEYEVARLHLDAAEQARRAAAFGPGATYRYLLHPPMLRALGLDRKMKAGPWIEPAFRALVRARRLRGTPADPFGRTAVRRAERTLVREYEAVVADAVAQLTAATQPLAAELCATPDVIRGYEEIKLASIGRWRERVAELRARLAAGDVSRPQRAEAAAPFTTMG